MDDERQPDKLSAAEARKVIREIASDDARLLISTHARERMERRSVSIDDVLKVVRTGLIVEGPYLGVKGDWRVELQRSLSEDVVSVAVAIKWRTRLLVVTVIKEESRGR
ncbi:MAG: DUF4258 domain-containing protein [Alphaproteobacteria bacterium]|nr:DUF4258 domain-containing protein [Alphaproteobacteria bacterium]